MQLPRAQPPPRSQVTSPRCLRLGEQSWRRSRNVSNWKECWSQSSEINMAKETRKCKDTSIMRFRDFWIQIDSQRVILKLLMKRFSSKNTPEKRRRQSSLREEAMKTPRAVFLSAHKQQSPAKWRRMPDLKCQGCPRLHLRGHRAARWARPRKSRPNQ